MACQNILRSIPVNTPTIFRAPQIYDDTLVSIKAQLQSNEEHTSGWLDDTTTWMDLKDVKEASPIELAKYAVANKINDKPAFVW